MSTGQNNMKRTIKIQVVLTWVINFSRFLPEFKQSYANKKTPVKIEKHKHIKCLFARIKSFKTSKENPEESEEKSSAYIYILIRKCVINPLNSIVKEKKV